MKVARYVIAAVLCMVLAGEASAATSAQIGSARAKALAWLIRNQNGDGSWQLASGLKVQPTAAVLDAFIKCGIKHGYLYSAGIAWLGNADSPSVDSLSRQIAVLHRSGQNIDPWITRLDGMVHANSKSWGAYSGYHGSFPDTALALDAILVTNTSLIGYAPTTSTFITNKQLSVSSTDNNYGWSYTPELLWATETTSVNPFKSRVIPTCYNLVALSHYKSKNSGVDTNITRGLSWLLQQQKADGGFTDDTNPSVTTGNVYETSLALIALNEAATSSNATAMGATPALAASQDFLISKQQEDGSWGGDPLQTAMAILAFPAPSPAMVDTDWDGVPDEVEAHLGLDPTVADARGFVQGNGEGETGITAPVLIATVLQRTQFNISLSASNGTPPYAWEILSGTLPDGTSLNPTTGSISGTPSVAGDFNFIYGVKDAVGSATAVVGKIVVEPLYSPIAAFTGSPTLVSAPGAVTFTNLTDTGTSWVWNFGDGTTSTLQSPSHVYSAPGTYNVTLTASNSHGSDSVTKQAYITATPCSNMPVRIIGKTSYTSLQAAYDAATDGDQIQCHAQDFVGDLNAARAITVTVDGGYSCDYLPNLGLTVLKGTAQLSDGVVKLKNIRTSQ